MSESQAARERVCVEKSCEGRKTQMIACGWNEAHCSPSKTPFLICQGGGGRKKADGGISLRRKEKNWVGNGAVGSRVICLFASQKISQLSFSIFPHTHSLSLSLSVTWLQKYIASCTGHAHARWNFKNTPLACVRTLVYGRRCLQFLLREHVGGRGRLKNVWARGRGRVAANGVRAGFCQVKEKWAGCWVVGGCVGGARGKGGGRGQGQRCKIYLLPSENFDPWVVNLSKESSQLNRKHEEEGGLGLWARWYVGVGVGWWRGRGEWGTQS